MTLIYPSHIPMFSPPRFSSTANSRFARLKSKPSVVRRGTLKLVRATSAWISAITGREPSITHATHVPGAWSGRPESSISDGFGTSTSPFCSISNTPISFVEPKRFLTARRMR